MHSNEGNSDTEAEGVDMAAYFLLWLRHHHHNRKEGGIEITSIEMEQSYVIRSLFGDYRNILPSTYSFISSSSPTRQHVYIDHSLPAVLTQQLSLVIIASRRSFSSLAEHFLFFCCEF